MDIPSQLIVYESDYWLLNHRMDSALPGYLMLGSKLPVDDLSELPDTALAELGPLLGKVQHTLQTTLEPNRVYISRYGHSHGYPIHFHVIPIYEWVEKLFWRDERYRIFERFTEVKRKSDTDGAELALFVWREFRDRPDPPPIEGPSVAAAIELMRAGMAKARI